MGISKCARAARLALFAALYLVATAGCSSHPTAPDRNQEWLTLDQYKARASSPGLILVNPVVSVPAGAEIELRISKKPTEVVGDKMDFIFYDALEPIDEQMVSVRLRAKKAVYLDLEHLLASTDKESWMPLAYHFFPFCRDTRVTIKTGGVTPDVVVPVSPSFEKLSMTRDHLSDPRLK